MNIFRKLINTILFFGTSFIIYGTIIYIDAGVCEIKTKKIKSIQRNSICMTASLFSYTPKIVYKGFFDLYTLIKNGVSINQIFKESSLTGMVAREHNSLSKRFRNVNGGFDFKYKKGERPNSGFILLSKANHLDNGKPSIELWDLNNQIMIYAWDLSKAFKYTKNNSQGVRYFLNPLVIDDGSLVFNTQGANNVLIRIDRCGEIQKINQELNFHHSINLDSKGNIYASFDKENREGYAILDQNLNILKIFYLDKIYEKYNLLPRIYSSNSDDPTHINDVEPIKNLQDNGEFQDLVLISLRSTSSIILYNQRSNKVVSIFDGFVSQQHDVDVLNLDPLEISIFDNNVLNENKSLGNKILFLKNISTQSNKDNTINVFMPNTKQFNLSNIKENVVDFAELEDTDRPKTKSSGLSEYNKINNSLIIEESNYGRIFEYDINTGKIVWSFLNTDLEKKNFWRMSWSRFYQDNPIKF